MIIYKNVYQCLFKVTSLTLH